MRSERLRAGLGSLTGPHRAVITYFIAASPARLRTSRPASPALLLFIFAVRRGCKLFSYSALLASLYSVRAVAY